MDVIFDPSLVLYLPLYKLDGVSFSSREAYGHLCMVTGAQWRHYGRYFDGYDDYVNAGAVLDFGSENFSILAWVLVNICRDTSLGDIMTDDLGGQHHYRLSVNTSHRAQFSVRDGTQIVTAVDTVMINDDIWHSLAGVRKGADFILYRDGIQTAFDTNGSIGNVNNDIGGQDWIGNAQEQGGRFPFLGLIGEVLAFTRALEPAEIHSIYQATKWRYR